MIQIGKQTLYNDDCLKILNQLEEKSVDIIITSPPYNLKKDYGTYKDDLPWEEYLQWIRQLGESFFKVLKDDGSFFLNIGSTNIDPTMSMKICIELDKIFKLQNDIVWVKSVTIDANSYGHFKPINSDRFLNNTHESIFHFTKTAKIKMDRLGIGVPFQDQSNVTRWKHGKTVRCRGNTWYIPYKTVKSKNEKFNHPAGFPIELPLTCIKFHGIRDDLVVLDPFLGTGSTCLAAGMLGVSGVGIELDRYFYDIALGRIKELSNE